MNRVRTPVAVGRTHDDELMVVCDDGAAYTLGSDNEWYSLPPIPGTLAARATEPVGIGDPRD